ncbi:MAG: amidohydrolase family protein [Phycisphaerae bacterium]|nr:amidohydrolase family protein [Phycisphaerae bacterium]
MRTIRRASSILALTLAAAAPFALAIEAPTSGDPAQPPAQPPTQPPTQPGALPLNPPFNGPRITSPADHALVNATVYPAPGVVLRHTTIVVRDGVITQLLPAAPGPDNQPNTVDDLPAPAPEDCRAWDCTDLHVYPGFIEPYFEVEPTATTNRQGAHWNTRVTPDVSAQNIDESAAASLRKMGFTVAGLVPSKGLIRGTTSVVSLAKPADDASLAVSPIIRDRVYQSLSFDFGGFGGGGGGPRQNREAGVETRWGSYPGSLMGAIALIRQTFIDADWQSAARAAGATIPLNSLDALNTPSRQTAPPLVFSVSDELDTLRAIKLAREFDRPITIVGSGLEFRRLGAISEAARKTPDATRDVSFIIPLSYPGAPDVSSVAATESVSLRELMNWEQGPTNPRRLDAAGLNVALTTSKSRDRSSFHRNLSKAIAYGLPADRAQAMLTTIPAAMLGISDSHATIAAGKSADFVIADNPLFAPEFPKLPDEKPADAKKDADKPADPNAKPSDKPGEKPEETKPEAKPETKPDAQPDIKPADAPQDEAPGRRGRGRRGGGGGGGPGAGSAGPGGATDAKSKRATIREVWVDGLRHELSPRPVSLEGYWSVTVEPAGREIERALLIDKDNGITIKRGEKTVRATKANFDNSLISFTFDHSAVDYPEENDVHPGFFTASAVVENDAAGKPGMMTGEILAPGGSRISFSAVRRPASPMLGSWRVTEADGVPRGIDEIDSLVMDLTESAGKPALKLSFTKPTKDGPAKDAGEKTTTVINADDVKIEGEKLTFTHDLKPIGGEGKSTDVVTLTNDTLAGESTLPDGVKHTYKAARVPPKPPAPLRNAADPSGAYLMVSIDDKPEALKKDDLSFIIIKDNSITLRGKGDKDYAATNPSVAGDRISYRVDLSQIGGQGAVNVTAIRYSTLLIGSMVVPDGSLHTFKAVRVGDAGAIPKFEEIDRGQCFAAAVPELLPTPFGAYGLLPQDQPAQENLILKNATVWTGDKNAVMRNAAVWIKDGKIHWVGPAATLDAGGSALADLDAARVVDVTGLHITPGIVDCHSHTGISRGVNEGGQAVTAEVRIQDVTDPDSISWYRQLAGGVTAVNNLHGSANPIGGQNCVNKNRWGAPHPDDLHFAGRDSYSDANPFAPAGAPQAASTRDDKLVLADNKVIPGIKFALGENVTQANGSGQRSRYPVSRMGVEGLIRDRFTAAQDYIKEWKAYSDKVSPLLRLRLAPDELRRRIAEIPAPRRDLELEAIAQLIERRRLIHCHSYRGDEILMLARLTRDFGFTLGTFQHNLEGYKVADAVKQSSRGPSVFSDWWAYKIEVQDAIPYAGAILHDVGAVVSFNSDSDELARRLNYDAAKAIRYSNGLSPEEALKFVTTNPAYQLAIDDRVGTIAVGKDADIVVWSGDPLSTRSRATRTFVDGKELFSLERDAGLRAQNAATRQRIIQNIIKLGEEPGSTAASNDFFFAGAGAGAGAGANANSNTSGADSRGMLSNYLLDLARQGIDPTQSRPLDCGCGLAAELHSLQQP